MSPWIPDEEYADMIARVAALESRKVEFKDLPWDAIIQKLSTESSFKGRDLLLKKSVGNDLLAADSVTSAELAANSVGSTEIEDDAVGTSERAMVPACRVYNSANISVNSGTTTLITCNSERFDDSGMHDTSINTGRITFATAGIYVVTAHVEWASNSTGKRSCEIRLNAAGSGSGGTAIAKTGHQALTQSEQTITTIYRFAANDYIELFVYQNSGGALNVVSVGNNSPEISAVWLSK